MSIAVTVFIKNSLHIGMRYIDFNVGPIAHMIDGDYCSFALN